MPHRTSWIVALLALPVFGWQAATISYCEDAPPAPKPVVVKLSDAKPAEGQPAVVKPADDAPPVKPAADTPTGGPEIAARFAALALDTLRQKVVLPPHFKQAAALLEAAVAQDPNEPRYAKMLYEAMLQMGDSEGALKAMTAYRKVNTQAANDQVAMVAFIDLKTRTLQTAGERADFLTGMLDSAAPEPVRAHVAFRASQIALERGQGDVENSLVTKSLELNPLNFDALRRKFELLTANNAPAIERVELLLQMLMANPIQPEVMYRLARECADAGMPEESLYYYKLSANVAAATGTAMGREFAMGYATELYLLAQPQLLVATRTIVDGLLKTDGGDVEALFLKWLADRASNEKDAAEKSKAQVINTSLNRVLAIRLKLGASGRGATTRPVEAVDAAEVPDLSGDPKTLEDDKYAGLRAPYIQAIADLAWYLIYVGENPVDSGKVLPTLKAVLSDTDPIVVRIEGFIAMKQGQLDQAKLKLQAAADRDVLARMGTLLLRAKDPAEKEKAAAEAKQLLADIPAGLLATVLMNGLRELDIKVVERQDAAALRAKIKAFPADFLRVAEVPNTFYDLRAEMVDKRVVFPYGDQMLATVYIRNRSKYTLTIGNEGIIKNDLWFDAQFRGLVQQTVYGAAYDRLGQAIVLKPGESVSQVFRFDQGQSSPFGQVIGNPMPTLTFYGQARTNPKGDGGSNLCGQNATFSTITERTGFAPFNAQGQLTPQAQQVLNVQLETGTPAEKLRSLDLVVAVITQMRAQVQAGAAQAQVTAIVNAFVEILEKKTADPVAGVSTWAQFLTAYQSAARAPAMMERLLTDKDPSRRLLGIMITASLPPEAQKAKLKAILEQDKEEMIQLYGSASLEIAEVVSKATPATPAPVVAPGAGAGEVPGGAPAAKP